MCNGDIIREAYTSRDTVMTAWGSVTQSTVSNCLRHVQIIPTLAATLKDIDDENDMPLSELSDLTRSLLNQSEMSAEEYVRTDKKEETGQQLNDDDI